MITKTRTVRRDTKKWAKAHARWKAETVAWLESIGAKESLDWYALRITTTLGTLYIDLDRENPTIFCRFDEPARARSATFGCNPYSGKWNFHGETHEGVNACFRTALERILPLPA